MEYVVLGLLLIHSLTLYELNQAFKQGISLFYSASYGSLQIAVKNLLEKDLIVFVEQVERGRNKKVYSITERGRQAFFQWMFDDIPASKLEVWGLSKVYFLGLIEKDEQKKQIVGAILEEIQEAEAGLRQVDAQIEHATIPDDYREIAKFHRKTLDYGLMSYAAARAWFAALLEELSPRP